MNPKLRLLMPLPTRIHFPAKLEQLPQMLEWIRDHLIQAKIGSDVVGKMELASEEALANIIQHGYPEKKGQIELQFHHLPGSVELVFMDQGPPFNPLESAPTPDLEKSLEEREVGGLGVFLMRKVVDDIRYSRENDTNVLILKHFSRKP